MKAKPSRPSNNAKKGPARKKAPITSRGVSKKRNQTGNRKPATRPLISTVIFDLDDTLYDCFRQRVQLAHRFAAEVMVKAGVNATVEEVFRARMAAFKKSPHLHDIDTAVLRQFGVRGDANPGTIEMRSRAAYFATPVGKMSLFPASRSVLRALAKRGVRIFIVTFGDPETQHAKVRALGLDKEKAVKKIFFADTGKLMTKEAIFKVIQQHEERDPERVLVVGDRPSSEIKAGKALGFHTARFRHGEFATLDPVGPEEEADHNIRSIAGVLKLPYRFGK